MSFRTIVITKESKLSLRMNHLVVKSETHTQVPIGEISCLIIENPNISITGHLMNALTENKIMTIVCGKDHLPQTFLHAVYGHHRQSRLIEYQMNWKAEYKERLWQMIVQKKLIIRNRFYDITLEHWICRCLMNIYKTLKLEISQIEKVMQRKCILILFSAMKLPEIQNM